MSCCPAAAYFAAAPWAALGAPSAMPLWAEEPAAEDAAAEGATGAAAAYPPEAELEPLPEQPAAAAAVIRIRQGRATAPARRRRDDIEESEAAEGGTAASEPGEREKRGERAERGEPAGTACWIRMPLGRHLRPSRLRGQVTTGPLFLRILASSDRGTGAKKEVRFGGPSSYDVNATLDLPGVTGEPRC